jgi:hypothetical protein
MRGVYVSAQLVPVVRDLFCQHPRAARLSPEQVAGLLPRILRYVPDAEDSPPEPFEVADVLEVLEVLDVERGLAA